MNNCIFISNNQRRHITYILIWFILKFVRIIFYISKWSLHRVKKSDKIIIVKFTFRKKSLESRQRIERRILTCSTYFHGVQTALRSILLKKIKNLNWLVKPIWIWLAKTHGLARHKKTTSITMKTVSKRIQMSWTKFKTISHNDNLKV
jgi:hypothetical protein